MASPIQSNYAFLDIFQKLEENVSQRKYIDAIDNMVKLNASSFSLNFEDFRKYDNDLANKILDNPKLYLRQIKKEVYTYLETKYLDYVHTNRRFSVRIINLSSLTPLEDLGANLVGRLLKVQGIVTRVGPFRLMVEKAVYQCISCGERYYGQIGELYQDIPKMCNFCKCRKFKMDENESIFVDSRWITIQDVEHIPKSKIDVLLTGDISEEVSLGK